MKKNPRILKNIVILIVAPILAILLFYLTQNFSWMTASVLDITEINTIKQNNWDLAYKTENQIFEVFWAEKVKSAEFIEFEILYNPERIELDTQLISWDNYQIIDSQEGDLVIQISDIWVRDYQEWWFEIPYTWDESQILMWDAKKLENGEELNLSVWNLNRKQEHSLLQ